MHDWTGAGVSWICGGMLYRLIFRKDDYYKKEDVFCALIGLVMIVIGHYHLFGN